MNPTPRETAGRPDRIAPGREIWEGLAERAGRRNGGFYWPRAPGATGGRPPVPRGIQGYGRPGKRAAAGATGARPKHPEMYLYPPGWRRDTVERQRTIGWMGLAREATLMDWFDALFAGFEDPPAGTLRIAFWRRQTQPIDPAEDLARHRARARIVHALVEAAGLDVRDWGDVDGDHPAEVVDIVVGAVPAPAAAILVDALSDRIRTRPDGRSGPLSAVTLRRPDGAELVWEDRQAVPLDEVLAAVDRFLRGETVPWLLTAAGATFGTRTHSDAFQIPPGGIPWTTPADRGPAHPPVDAVGTESIAAPGEGGGFRSGLDAAPGEGILGNLLRPDTGAGAGLGGTGGVFPGGGGGGGIGFGGGGFRADGTADATQGGQGGPGGLNELGGRGIPGPIAGRIVGGVPDVRGWDDAHAFDTAVPGQDSGIGVSPEPGEGGGGGAVVGGGPRVEVADGEAAGDDDDPPGVAYARLECSETIVAGEPFDLTVGIAATQALGVFGGRFDVPAGAYVLTIQVIANGFTAGDGVSLRQELRVTAADRYPSVALRLTADAQAEDVRLRTIQATYFVSSQPIGVAYRPVAVVKARHLLASAAAPAPPRAMGLGTPGSGAPPDLTVIITDGDDDDLDWTFESPHRFTRPDKLAIPIGDSPEAFTQMLIDEMNQSDGKPLTMLMHGFGEQIALVMPGQVGGILREIAPQLGGRPPTVLILSHDPHIPWELAVLDPPVDATAAPFLGAQAVVGRWVQPRPGQRKPKHPPLELRSAGSMAVLCGVYPEDGGDDGEWTRLEQAEAEAQDLTTLYQASRVTADWAGVKALLHAPADAEMIHLAGHAVYRPGSTATGFVLDDLTYLTPSYVFGGRLSAAKPFVFLNACQAGSDYAVLGAGGGLASAFLVAGASAVVAPLWSVDDAQARDACLEFYRRALAEGETPAEILRARRARFGRDAAGNEIDADSPTAMAYQFFGHPNMRLVRP